MNKKFRIIKKRREIKPRAIQLISTKHKLFFKNSKQIPAPSTIETCHKFSAMQTITQPLIYLIDDRMRSKQRTVRKINTKSNKGNKATVWERGKAQQ